MALIKTIDELRKYVKINKSKDFETYEMFIQDAQEKYIEPYFGSTLLETLETKANDELRLQICRALGPFSLALATDEFSILFGETGHTVARSEKVAPASDAKIEKATQSLFERGWSNLDRAISIVRQKASTYPEWTETEFSKKLSSHFFSSAREFQDNGMVNINYSSLTFYYLRLLILRIEKSETLMFVPAETRKIYLEDPTQIPATVLSTMQAYTGSRVAAIHSSKLTREQRGKPRNITEYRPLVRPLYENEEETLNYLEQQADFWKGAMYDALEAENIIESGSRSVKWNEQDKKVFVANAQRL